MAGKPQLVLLTVLTRLYLGNEKTAAVFDRFLEKELSPTEAVLELRGREFSCAEVEIWFFFYLFSSARNRRTALELLGELTQRGTSETPKLRPEDAMIEFRSLIDDEREHPPQLPPPRAAPRKVARAV